MKNREKRRQLARDPVCGRRINRNKAHITIRHEGYDYPLCCPKCQSEFEKHPQKYAVHTNKGTTSGL